MNSLTPRQQMILDELKQSPKPLAAKEIKASRSKDYVRMSLYKLRELGFVRIGKWSGGSNATSFWVAGSGPDAPHPHESVRRSQLSKAAMMRSRRHPVKADVELQLPELTWIPCLPTNVPTYAFWGI